MAEYTENAGDRTASHGPGRRVISRRDFLVLAGGAGAFAMAGPVLWRDGYAFAAGSGGVSSLGTGTVPEQIHMTWGSDASNSLTISWASPQPQTTPQVTLTPSGGSPSVYGAVEKSYTDGLSGESVYAYHVALTGLTPDTTYSYVVEDAASPSVTFESSFTTAQTGRFPFAFTSYGDLGTPGAGATYTLANGSTIQSTTYSESQWNAYNAVGEVENLAPLFHLLNGDLCYADKETINSSGQTGTATSGVQPAPEVWRDFGLNVQRSAANRPWMPCIGNHEAELDNGPYGYASFNTRYLVPSNGTSFPGNFYSFRVGSVLFIALDANDVCYQGAGAYNVAGVATSDAESNPISAYDYQYNQYYTGTFTSNSNGTLSPGGAVPNAQTQWLEQTLSNARADTTIDWIIVQMHQCALSSSTDNGCDAGIRQAWVPLFDEYQVDLVLNGHDHDYERSYPVRGFTANEGTSTWKGMSNASWGSNYIYTTAGPTILDSTNGETVNTFTPAVVSTDETSPFNTSEGTVYMVLGGGGTNKQDNKYNSGTANVTTFTQIRVGAAYGGGTNGTVSAGTKPLPDSSEPCNWSANKDTADAYGIALFSVDPGEAGGNTTITVTYYHAPTQTSGAPNYSQYDTFQLTRSRSDSAPVDAPEFSLPDLAVPAAAVIGGGAFYLKQRRAERTEKVPVG